MSFDGKVCVVTGATSGIGYAIASELAARGANLLLVGRNVEKGNALAQSLGSAGVKAHFFMADLADRAAPQSILHETLSRFRSVDVLVNNAGLMINGTAEECSDEDWDRVIDINLTAAFRMSRTYVGQMVRQGSGNIVNIASDWALMGARGATAYCVSKAGLTQLTRCMALDYARSGVRVNAVCPGDTDTPMLDQAFAGRDRATAISALSATIPMGRIAKAEEVARVVAFVASNEASFMTGALISVDGGTTSQ